MDPTPPDVERTVAMINLAMAALVAAGSYPLFTGQVPRNRSFGLRTAKSLASDTAWVRANRILAEHLLGAAALIAVISGLSMLGLMPGPEAWHDDVIMYITPTGLLLAGGTAWLRHTRD